MTASRTPEPTDLRSLVPWVAWQVHGLLEDRGRVIGAQEDRHALSGLPALFAGAMKGPRARSEPPCTGPARWRSASPGRLTGRRGRQVLGAGREEGERQVTEVLRLVDRGCPEWVDEGAKALASFGGGAARVVLAVALPGHRLDVDLLCGTRRHIGVGVPVTGWISLRSSYSMPYRLAAPCVPRGMPRDTSAPRRSGLYRSGWKSTGP